MELPPFKASLATDLLTWYATHGRDLPWRHTTDPYAIWVAEVMLQQTQVKTVLPYYAAFLAHFPTLADFAAAPLDQVLKRWEGLGYYARARNFHAAARQVVHEFGGHLPADVDALRRLPGVGAYTAGSLASLIFDLPEPAVDGNVLRVLARVYAHADSIDSTAARRTLSALARRQVPPSAARDYNSALMDLGATVCTPQNPQCLLCPLRAHCDAYAQGRQAELPVRAKRAATPHYAVSAGVIWQGEQVLIAQRPLDKLLGGLWEFPGGKCESGESLEDCLQRELREELTIGVELVRPWLTLKHAFTHFKITLHTFVCRITDGTPHAVQVADWRWVTPDSLSTFAFGKTDSQIAHALMRGEGRP